MGGDKQKKRKASILEMAIAIALTLLLLKIFSPVSLVVIGIIIAKLIKYYNDPDNF